MEKALSPYRQAPFGIRILAVFTCFLLVIATLFVSVMLTVNLGADNFFYKEYKKLDNARYMGMSTEDLTAATMQMIHYMEGSADSIDIDVTVYGETVSMFNDRERAHMVDVRALYLGWVYATIGCLVLFTAFWIWQRKRHGLFFPALWRGAGVLLIVLIGLGIWVVLDFYSFWTCFHLLFFTNDLWLLDPETSRMINMMPLELFYDVVVRMALFFVGIWAIFGVGVFLRRIFKKKANQTV